MRGFTVSLNVFYYERSASVVNFLLFFMPHEYFSTYFPSNVLKCGSPVDRHCFFLNFLLLICDGKFFNKSFFNQLHCKSPSNRFSPSKRFRPYTRRVILTTRKSNFDWRIVMFPMWDQDETPAEFLGSFKDSQGSCKNPTSPKKEEPVGNNISLFVGIAVEWFPSHTHIYGMTVPLVFMVFMKPI